ALHIVRRLTLELSRLRLWPSSCRPATEALGPFPDVGGRPMLKSQWCLVRSLILLGVLAASGPLIGPGIAAARSGAIIVGDGTPASGTETASRQALAVASASGGGTIHFKCGTLPITITLTEPAATRADALIVLPDETTINGGGTITLRGMGAES